MNSDIEKIERTMDEHQEYLESVGDAIVEGLWEGMKVGVTKGAKRGVRHGLKECLAQGFMNIGEGAIEDVVGHISEVAISTDVTKGTSPVIESGLKGYLDRLGDGIMGRVRGRDLVLAVNQIGRLVELIKGRQQRMAQGIGEKFPRNPLSSPIVAGAQTALDEGLNRDLQGFRTKIQEELEGGAEGRRQKLQGPAREHEAERIENIKAIVRDSVARVVEEVVYRIIRQITRRTVADLRKELKEKAIHRLEKALKKTAEQKLEQGLDRSISLLTEEIAKDSADKMTFVGNIDESFGNSFKGYLSSLPKGPGFPWWAALIGVAILGGGGILYALAPDNELPRAPHCEASVDWIEGLTVGFSSEGSYDPDGYIESYYWDFGDGHTSEEPDPVHTYEEAGNYTAVLNVTDDVGWRCEDRAYVDVTYGMPLPDLVITEVWHIHYGQNENVVHYRIENQGEAEADLSSTVLYIGDEPLCEHDVDPLRPGEAREIELSGCVLTDDDIAQLWLHPLWLHADWGNIIAESDEENNSMAYE